uniref:HMG box domain-containing protein n=1 Tax=Glossina brevipalpis TaxID=37001 RepID=A0A1A9WVQ1_9MUSC
MIIPTVSLFGKTSLLLGSLVNKFRQVIHKHPPSTKPTIINKIHDNISNPLIPEIATTTMPTVMNVSLPLNETENNNNNNEIYRPITAANLCLSSIAKATKSLEEQIGLPPKPKKPLTPYFRFMMENRPKIKIENPKLPPKDIVRLVSKKWESTEPSIKTQFQEKYQKDRLKYIETRTKYEANITDEQRKEMKQLKLEMREVKEKRLMRKRMKELGRPKRPLPGFIKFVAKERVNTPPLPKQPWRDWFKKAAIKWSQLSDDEKGVYINETRKELETYRKEVALWEEKMIRQGNVDVVRHGSLIDPPEPKPKKK